MNGPELEISKEIHALKYRTEGETFKEAMTRVADALKDDQEHFLQFRDILYDMRFLPAGRVQSAMGAPRTVTPYNCYVMGTIEDSMDGIMKVLGEAAETMRMGGGVGYDFSTLRPRGALIKSLDSRSSGPVAFMDIYDAMCGTISSAGHRRGAQMAVLRVDHPDIEEFVTAKANDHRLTNFNISVGVTDEFMEAVKADGMFDLRFDGRVYKTIRARALWDKILRNTWDWAEPGVLFIDRMNKKNNLWYCETIAATNPCFSGDTRILTTNGYRTFKELDGQNVNLIAHDGTVSQGKVWMSGVKQTVFINFEGDRDSIQVTPDHVFMDNEGNSVRASDLKGRRVMPYIEEAPVVLEEKLFLAGFILGDGALNRLNSEDHKGIEVFFNREKDKEISNHYDPSGTGKSWYSVEARVVAEQFNLPAKKIGERGFPTSMANRTSLQGLYSANGSVIKNGRVALKSIDKEQILGVQSYLKSLGIESYITTNNPKVITFSNGDYVCKESYDLNIARYESLLKFAKLINFAQAYKRKELREMLIRKAPYVRSVKVGPEVEVYDFNEPHTHWGVVEGIVAHNCGEQPLPPYGACLLGSLNLTRYIEKQHTPGEVWYTFNWEKFIHDIPLVVRAMDNVVDRAIYPLPAQEQEAKNKRRMGLGVTGLANTMEILGMPYGSQEALHWTEQVMSVLRDTAYRTSVSLAIEKGPFPLFDVKLLDSEFAQTLPRDLREDIRKYGLRNSHLLSIAPTGTISLTANNVSSGIEPVFSHQYERDVRTFDGIKTEVVKDYAYNYYGVKGRTADELSVFDHVAMLNVASKYIDSACSKTCNVGDDVSWEEFKEVYMRAYDGGASGCTTFRASGKRFGILRASKDEEVVEEPEVPKDDFVSEGAACFIDPSTGIRTCDT